MSEVKIIFKVVSISVPLAVEVLSDEPVGVEELLGNISTSHTDSIEKKNLEFIVGDSVVGA